MKIFFKTMQKPFFKKKAGPVTIISLKTVNEVSIITGKMSFIQHI